MKDKVKKYMFDYRKQKGTFPSPRIIAYGLDIDKSQVLSSFRELASDGILKMYPGPDAAAVSSYRVPTSVLQKELEQGMEKERPLIQKIISSTRNSLLEWIKQGFKITLNIESLVRFICFAIASVAIYVTATMSNEWTRIMFDNQLTAFLLSLLIPSFSTIMFEGSIILFREKTAVARTIGTVIIIMVVFALLFDSSMIIIAQYNKRVVQVAEQNEIKKTENTSNALYVLYQKEETEIEKEILNLEKKLSEERQKRDDFEINSKSYNNQNWKITQTEKKIETKQNELSKKRNQISEILKTENVSVEEVKKDDVYKWLANSFTGGRVEMVEFILFSILAIFLVVVAPVGMFVALGLWKDRKEKE